jgi:hypothetical protein
VVAKRLDTQIVVAKRLGPAIHYSIVRWRLNGLNLAIQERIPSAHAPGASLRAMN